MNKDQKPSQKDLDKLLVCYQNKEYVEAENLANKITQNFPNHAFSWKTLASIYKITGRLAESLLLHKRVIELSPKDFEAHGNMANTLRELGRLKEAEESYRHAINIKPDFAESYSSLGITLGELGRLEEAEASCRKAIELKPHLDHAHNNLGIILRNLRKLEEAEASFRQAITLNPNLVVAYNNLGNSQKNGGKLKEAELSYGKAIELKPDYAEAFNNLGAALQEQDKLDEAELNYKHAIELKPDYDEAFKNLGGLLHRLNRYEEAEVSYTKAIELKPDNEDTSHLLAALKGEITKSAPKVYVENLFNNYADKFDKSLVDQLEYDAPKLVSKLISNNYNNKSLGSILDLGCGTGLVGEEIGHFCDYIEGIDLSGLMIDIAAKKNVYDKLSRVDILDYLNSKKLDFDYFIFTDVFVYLGDLTDVFRLINSRNKSSGKLVFTTEDTDKKGYFLEKSGRFSHSKSYIEELCKEFNYRILNFEKFKLRKHGNKYIQGGLYILEF